ncbi:ArsR family transcriptional regulator [Halostagnicola larsenii XH-48]|uniref:ArsR family transcriptional regulator n=1 Tax=Halostagnicola larsenii XH-48 TaxID=797299 RepID=W0JR39_9EURY|nr:PaaX domain-containing protein [Halostagnicola larsenii]AHF99426.1 ArsR family transcriptional regulator [Halostagnicola larsenii XH-48]AHF99437.1 ArsR family transcriptional regulator [Halostagnicola larsenii XH-48]
MPDQFPQEVADLSPGARLVYRALGDGPMTIDEIQTETALSKRSIYNCTSALEDVDVIEVRTDVSDARKRLYVRT